MDVTISATRWQQRLIPHLRTRLGYSLVISTSRGFSASGARTRREYLLEGKTQKCAAPVVTKRTVVCDLPPSPEGAGVVRASSDYSLPQPLRAHPVFCSHSWKWMRSHCSARAARSLSHRTGSWEHTRTCATLSTGYQHVQDFISLIRQVTRLRWKSAFDAIDPYFTLLIG